MVRARSGKGGVDRRELPGKASVKQVTRKPKGIRPEEQEPKHPRVKTLLGQSGKRDFRGMKNGKKV